MFSRDTQRRNTALRILLALVAAAALFLIGRATVPGEPFARSVDGIPVGFAKSPDGARAAALTFASARARAVLLEPRRRRPMLKAIGTGRFARAADLEDARRDLAPLTAHEQARYLVSGLGTRIVNYTTERASVQVWFFQVLGADTAVGSFSTQNVALVWQDKRWRLDGQSDAPQQAIPEIVQTARRAETRAVMADLHAPSFGRP